MTTPSRQLAAAVRRHSDAAKRVVKVLPTPLEMATVTLVQPGAASDGNALVTVTAHGSSTIVEGYAPSYTPAVSDRVVIAVIDAQWIILSAIVGQP